MKRIQLFEFEDFDWFPTTFRSTMTKLIVVLHKLVGTAEVLAHVLKEVRNTHKFDQLVDIGSGSGGAMPMAMEILNQDEKDKVSLLLTDLHPNPEFVQNFNQKRIPNISYHTESLDATNMANTPAGLKTMVNSFHHMAPPIAKKILRTAQENRQGLLIYEMAENNIPTFLWWLLLPLSLVLVGLMAILFLPFIRPLNWRDILFTIIIPLVPIFYAWDGQATTMRIYTFKDLEELLPGEVEAYTWKMEVAKKPNGKKAGYYVLGLPLE